jgi:SAM-dependent methyltransferase
MPSPWENSAFATESLAHVDEKFLPQTQQQTDWLMRKMQLRPGDTLLDLGCGAGRHAIAFSQLGVRVTGIDISETMLAQARARAAAAGADICFLREDLANLAQLRLPIFQGAICLCESGFGVLGGEGKDFAFLRQVHALLAPGARFALTCFNALRRYLRDGDRNPRFDYINGTMDWSCELADGTRLRELGRQYTPSEIQLLLRLCGFQEIEVLSCAEGQFSDAPVGIEDIELLVCAKRGESP